MVNEEIVLYRHWLKNCLEKDKQRDKSSVQESFMETIMQSPSYHTDSLVNGELQPIVATRTETKKCKITVVPGSTLHIGDLVHVFNEDWICVELYTDEFGMQYGELWMCNQIFIYQDHDLNVIQKPAVLDDGSYSSGNDKAIMVTDNSFNCYISLDAESNALFIDKRLAIGVIYDSKGNKILEVGKIKWIDVKSKNFGEGSHLMVFGINDDAYSPEHDSIEKMICDYREPVEQSEEPTEPPEEEDTYVGKLVISGRSTIRIGSARTYTVSAVSDSTGETIAPSSDVVWTIVCESEDVTIQPDGLSCKVAVKEDDDLVGVTFTLKCESENFAAAEFLVGVV